MNDKTLQIKNDEPEPLPDLIGKLAGDMTDLVDAKLTLLKIELREEVTTYIRGTAMIAAGAVVALVGFALLNVAIAFVVSTFLQDTALSQPARYAIGFAITALVHLSAGGGLIVVSKNKVAAQSLVPKRTVAELRKDKKAIEEEI
jgi:uncharacterized membrane protein YqjE